ncbi:MAG: lipoprotein insertase outer membrane protein LolB [Pseudomonadota bacterium]
MKVITLSVPLISRHFLTEVLSLFAKSRAFLAPLRCVLLIALTASVTGCSIPTPDTQRHDKTVSQSIIDAHQQQLDSINRWQLSARMAVIQKRNNERDGLYVDWQWQPNNSPQQRLRFSHPLKGQVAELTVDDQFASLNYDGQRYNDRSAERLLKRLLKVEVPVTALSQWALGKTTARLKQLNYLADGKLAAATVETKAGELWKINWYYQQQLLPTQVHLESNQIKLKMQINEWQTWPQQQDQQ